MGRGNTSVTNISTLVVGCTPLARKVTALLEEISNLVGVVNLHPEKGLSKSNYDYMADFVSKRPDDVFWTKDINDEETINWMLDRQPDIVVQCGWSQIFKPQVLEIPTKYCIGIHPSPLPVGRGAAVINWKLIQSMGQEVNWGNSLFVMEPKTDTGAVLDFEPFTLEPRDDIRTAYLKVDKTALTMLSRTLLKIENDTLEPTPQDKTKTSRFYKRKPKDGELDLSWPAVNITDYVRALTHPYPGAFFKLKNCDLFVWRVSKGLSWVSEPGTILMIEKGKGIRVKVGYNDSIWLERISVNGVEQWADDWAADINLKERDNLRYV